MAGTWVTQPVQAQSTIISGGGTGTVTYQRLTQYGVRINSLSVAVPGTTQGQAAMYLNGMYVVGTSAGWGDTAGGDPPCVSNPGDTVTVVWTGCLPGSTAQALFTCDAEVY